MRETSAGAPQRRAVAAIALAGRQWQHVPMKDYQPETSFGEATAEIYDTEPRGDEEQTVELLLASRAEARCSSSQ